MDSRSKTYTTGAAEHAPTTTGLFVAEEPKCGPEPGRNVRCIRCHKLIADGELWRRVHAPDFSYAVAIHTACMSVRP